jgi:hypothetical protein
MPDVAQQYKTIRTPDGTTHRFPSDATDDQINEALNPPPKVEAPPSAMSRFGTGLYNTTVGPLVNTAKSFVQHPIDTTISTLTGSSPEQWSQSLEQAKQGNYSPGIKAISDAARPMHRMSEGVVNPIVSDVQQGNYAGALGQATGVGGSLAAGAYLPESTLGKATGAAVKAAAPDLGVGGLKTGLGAGAGMVAHEMGVPSSYAGMGGLVSASKGLNQMGEGLAKGARAFGEAWKGPKIETPQPPEIPNQKAPTTQQMRTAVINGTRTPEQFDAHIDSLNDLTPEAKQLHKDDLRSSMQKVSPPNMGIPEKPLSLGTLKSTVKAGDRDINWFKDKLKQQGHSDEGIELESKRLAREIEETKKKADSSKSPSQ